MARRFLGTANIRVRPQVAPCPDPERFIKEMLHQMNILRVTIPVVFLSWVNLAARAESGSPTLEAQIPRIANARGGEVGVAAWRLDGTGPRMLLNADEAFPMASTFKVAVAGALLGKVDAGTLSLETVLPVDKSRYVE